MYEYQPPIIELATALVKHNSVILIFLFIQDIDNW